VIVARWQVLLVVLLLGAASSGAQDTTPTGLGHTSPGGTILDSITVIATRGEHSVAEVPGTVTVIDAQRVDDVLMRDLRDLVRYEPGVYVENSATRLGLGAFNIRGIGGNRVLTRIDGVPAAESFEFGHFEVPQFTLDLDAVDRVEILRGPGSSLYGSDALGGVVSFATRDPLDLLTAGRSSFLGLATSWDSRRAATGAAATVAGGGGTWQALATLNASSGGERANQGSVATRDATRSAPNPQDYRSLGFLGKVVHQASEQSEYELALEVFAHDNDTALLSDLGRTDLGAVFGFGPEVTYLVDKTTSTAQDEQARRRLSLENSRTGGALGNLLWRLYGQSTSTEQRTSEDRTTTLGGGAFGPLTTTEIRRTGLVTFEQETLGGELQAQRAFSLRAPLLLTFGAAASWDRFDQLRDRRERDSTSGLELPSADGLVYPTKYFPPSRVLEAGLFAQAEISLANGRLTVVPGLRYDRMELAVDGNDPVFLTGNEGTPAPVELAAGALSPKLGLVLGLGARTSLHAQYARGFRAPPYSAVNSGFTHLAGGLTRLPNPALRPEESDGLELGLRLSTHRGSFNVTGFDNHYDGFIELVNLGRNPLTGLVEFQQRNLAAARIRGFEAATDLHFGARWYLRASLAWIEGEDRSRGVPLNSIEPPRLAAGLGRSSADRSWRTELAARLTAAKDPSDLDRSGAPQFATPAWEVVDFFTTHQLSPRLSLTGGFWNLTDATYWEWADARGQTADSPALDRFTAPGRSASLVLRYRR